MLVDVIIDIRHPIVIFINIIIIIIIDYYWGFSRNAINIIFINIIIIIWSDFFVSSGTINII